MAIRNRRSASPGRARAANSRVATPGIDASTKNSVYRQIFAQIDSDKSGSIDSSELGFALTKMFPGATFTDRNIKQMLKSADLNHDGQISYDEFSAIMKNAEGNKRSLWGKVEAGFFAQLVKNAVDAFNVIDNAIEGKLGANIRAGSQREGNVYVATSGAHMAILILKFFTYIIFFMIFSIAMFIIQVAIVGTFGFLFMTQHNEHNEIGASTWATIFCYAYGGAYFIQQLLLSFFVTNCASRVSRGILGYKVVKAGTNASLTFEECALHDGVLNFLWGIGYAVWESYYPLPAFVFPPLTLTFDKTIAVSDSIMLLLLQFLPRFSRFATKFGVDLVIIMGEINFAMIFGTTISQLITRTNVILSK